MGYLPKTLETMIETSRLQQGQINKLAETVQKQEKRIAYLERMVTHFEGQLYTGR